MKFEKDREYLKKYIQKHFRDADMIDYEKETRDLAMDGARMTDKDIDR